MHQDFKPPQSPRGRRNHQPSPATRPRRCPATLESGAVGTCSRHGAANGATRWPQASMARARSKCQLHPAYSNREDTRYLCCDTAVQAFVRLLSSSLAPAKKHQPAGHSSPLQQKFRACLALPGHPAPTAATSAAEQHVRSTDARTRAGVHAIPCQHRGNAWRAKKAAQAEKAEAKTQLIFGAVSHAVVARRDEDAAPCR